MLTRLAAERLQAGLRPVELELMADVDALVARILEVDLHVDGKLAPAVACQLKRWLSFRIILFDLITTIHNFKVYM